MEVGTCEVAKSRFLEAESPKFPVDVSSLDVSFWLADTLFLRAFR